MTVSNACKTKLSIFVLCILLIFLVACAESTLTMGVIEFTQGDPITIDIPETVVQGEDFQVTIRTYAGGCEREIRSTNVRVRGSEVLIVPYNTKTTSRTCTADLLYLDHVATLNFDQAGTVTVTVRGRSELQGRTIDVLRTVTVQ